ncbi:endonuclease/exonuclease/phosphatase family protein [Ideonella sp. BN130291]|uniref:endonuclease/exonuclease/phosphatase family protein n=1 Tax=Ideonella sp. BN130291 TaxID=3112940 RepID=UPI002E266EC8|nr:endonuclease/exonuclease/phosphatase family protein [Ideonella sp. BN130291]
MRRWRAGIALLGLLLPALCGSAEATARLRLVSWNAEWLADPTLLAQARYWTECVQAPHAAVPMPPCDAYSRHNIADAAAYAQHKLAPLRSTLASLADEGMDVLALQEVQNAAAVQAVLPPGYRLACITQGRTAQNLAFVVREAARLAPTCREIASLGLEDDTVPHALRRGLELTVQAGGRAVVLLNLHLKAGCAFGAIDAGSPRACQTWQQQRQALQAWIEGQAMRGSAFAIVGDWNRKPDARTPWRGIDFVRVDRRGARHRCHRDLDQLALSAPLRSRLAGYTLPASGQAGARLLPAHTGASDHCPLRADLSLR